ncbi:hypothetical protein [Candidatus Poriferisocius sp.]|uniref:hypothetical protein n=1 Tax=Candidatus Poriferisocius sp. TaxID=3101276 RepID=UPI003B01A3A2
MVAAGRQPTHWCRPPAASDLLVLGHKGTNKVFFAETCLGQHSLDYFAYSIKRFVDFSAVMLWCWDRHEEANRLAMALDADRLPELHQCGGLISEFPDSNRAHN